MSRHVLIVDVDRLQEYVFATHRLREIRGASALLSKVEGEIKREVVAAGGAGNVIWLTPSGGTLRAVLDADDVPGLAEGVAAMYADETHLATAACHAEPVLDGERIGETLNRAERKLMRKKAGDVRVAWFPSHPLFRLCELCGQFPAMNRSQDRLLCDACLAKSEMAGSGTQAAESEAVGPAQVAEDACKQAGAKVGTGLTFGIPNSFHGLVMRSLKEDDDDEPRDDAAERRYMGVICADANGMGEIWRGLCNSKQMKDEDYRDISAAIAEATEGQLAEAVVATLKERWADNEEGHQAHLPAAKKVLPFVPLIVGGDDVVCVVPAEWALDVAQRFCQGFADALEVDFQCLGATRPGMSAGVVMCKYKFPIQLALDLARQLLREAKRRCRELVAQGEVDPGAIDFAVVMESSPQALSEVRADERLTERPYLVTGCGSVHLPLAALMNAAQKQLGAGGDREVPRSKWKDLSRILRLDNADRRTYEYDEWVAGLSKPQGETWRAVCAQLGLVGSAAGDKILAERPCDGRTRTGLLDLVEILDILERGR